MSQKTPDHIIERIFELRERHGWGRIKIHKQLEREGIIIGRRTIASYLNGESKYEKKQPKEEKEAKEKVSWEENGEEATIYAKTKARTLEEFIEVYDIDLDKWEIERHIINQWGVGTKTDNGVETIPLFQIKVFLKKKKHTVDVVNVFYELKEELSKVTAPKLKKYKYKNIGGLFEIDIFDPHIGKLCWLPETNNNYDIDIAEKTFLDIIKYFLLRAKIYKTEKILFPVGNDLFHIDTKSNTTTAGTPQDVDGRHQKVFKRGCSILIKAIELLRSVAPVDVIIIAGNHDELSTMHAGEVLNAWFRNERDVNINTDPILRKYYTYHNTLIGFTHGDKEKKSTLPLIMAQEQKENWANTEFRYFRIAHTHHRQKSETQTTLDHKGVIVTTGKSISPADAWHFGKGFVGSIRGAEAYFYSKESGQIDEFSYNISPDQVNIHKSYLAK